MINIGANHNFPSEKVAVVAKLSIERMCKLNVQLAGGKTHNSLGLSHAVCANFSLGVVQPLDFWVVPLAMDAILGIP